MAFARGTEPITAAGALHRDGIGLRCLQNRLFWLGIYDLLLTVHDKGDFWHVGSMQELCAAM